MNQGGQARLEPGAGDSSHRGGRRCRRAAVIGGGINGVMTAWALRMRGWEVEVIERRAVMAGTSSASTKLLHGGIRYLERGDFRLVREALRERAWWISRAPHLCHPMKLVLPVRTTNRRSKWKLRLGLGLYDWLAGRHSLGNHRWIPREQVLEEAPDLRSEGLVGGFGFWDGQMDDQALGCWAADQAREAGVRIRENCEVHRICQSGEVLTETGRERHDVIINAAGPWARELLERSGIASRYHLDLVRGSHLVVARHCARGIIAEVPGETRVGFVLPWKSKTLVGTTEVRQASPDSPCCSKEEAVYLRGFFDSVMAKSLADSEVESTFSGVRPLIRGDADPTRASREYALEQRGRVLSIFGGKWTTARALGEHVAGAVRLD